MFEIIRFLIMAEIGDVRQLRITCVWFTSANVISLKVWSITKIVINSNCDDVTMTEKINERSAYKALNSTHRWATNSAFVDVSNAINYQYSEEREKKQTKALVSWQCKLFGSFSWMIKCKFSKYNIFQKKINCRREKKIEYQWKKCLFSSKCCVEKCRQQNVSTRPFSVAFILPFFCCSIFLASSILLSLLWFCVHIYYH